MPKVSLVSKNKNRKPMSFEVAMKKFKKAVDAAGTLQEVKRREYYEKPAQARVRKKKAAEARWRKKVQQTTLRK